MSLEECLKYRSEYMESGVVMNSDVDVLLWMKTKDILLLQTATERQLPVATGKITPVAGRRRTLLLAPDSVPPSFSHCPPVGGRDACSSLRSTFFYRRIHVMSAGRVMDLLAMTILLLTAFSCLILPAGALDVGKSTLSCLFILQWEFCANIRFILIWNKKQWISVLFLKCQIEFYLLGHPITQYLPMIAVY